jgi:quercetin dioxygenase-like cupin family protein
MVDAAGAAPAGSPIPLDDLRRTLTVADAERPGALRISIAGGVYTILVTGEETAGRYCLIDMYVPAGGGPPPHRHDFEEMFTLLEGELAFTFRGATTVVRAGATVNVPANAPHFFRNVSDKPARMLCMCTPPGQEHYFLEVGDPIDSRMAEPPKLSREEIAARRARAQALAAKYRTEFLTA